MMGLESLDVKILEAQIKSRGARISTAEAKGITVGQAQSLYGAQAQNEKERAKLLANTEARDIRP